MQTKSNQTKRKPRISTEKSKKQEFLNGQEHTDYMDDISSVFTDLIGKVLFIADKHNVDRDNAMQHFSQLLSAMVQVSTFEYYGEEVMK